MYLILSLQTEVDSFAESFLWVLTSQTSVITGSLLAERRLQFYILFHLALPIVMYTCFQTVFMASDSVWFALNDLFHFSVYYMLLVDCFTVEMVTTLRLLTFSPVLHHCICFDIIFRLICELI